MKGNFKIIILAVFIFAAVFSVLVFSGTIPIGEKNKSGASGTVTLWGTVRISLISQALEEFNRANPELALKYVEKSRETFDQDLLEALASGVGPDMFFLTDELVFGYKNKITPIPYDSFSVASFRKTFAGAGEVFMTSNGILALPIAVDPLVMYYNRSMLDANGILYPPEYWDEFPAFVPRLTKKDENNRILKSTVALGQFANIVNAKDILTTLFMQSGNTIIKEENGVFSPALSSGNSKYNLGSILKFYTDFADPLSEVYSWNRSFTDSRSAFSSEDVAFYFGHASELRALVNANPNQNFTIASVPQIRGEVSKLTSARVIGIAVAAASRNTSTAFYVANALSTGEFAANFANALGIAPVRRDLLTRAPSDAYSPVFYASALYARTWLDPSSADTDRIFSSIVESVLSNSLSPSDAIRDADSKMTFLLSR